MPDHGRRNLHTFIRGYSAGHTVAAAPRVAEARDDSDAEQGQTGWFGDGVCREAELTATCHSDASEVESKMGPQ